MVVGFFIFLFFGYQGHDRTHRRPPPERAPAALCWLLTTCPFSATSLQVVLWTLEVLVTAVVGVFVVEATFTISE